MKTYKCEYIWLDGYQPEANLRSKTKIVTLEETPSIDRFSYGVSDRGASIRIPLTTVENNWKGYLEDRRPASNACPYQIAAKLTKTVEAVLDNTLVS
jgi:glutamine synthetase